MNFANPHFAEPLWLWLAGLGPLFLFALQRRAARTRRQQLARVAAPRFITTLTRSHSPGRRRLKEGLQLAAVALLGLALARPQWGELESQDQWLGEDVMFVLDCSNSMLATDVAPNRLQRAKLAIMDFVRRHGTGRVGLVAFAGGAFLQCPLTFDYDAFEQALTETNEKAIPVGGTDIGRALEVAFRGMEAKSPRKAIVLLTDGEDLVHGGVKAAEKLAAEGVKVYTIGVGTPAGAEIRIRTPDGQADYLRDRQGEIVRSQLDEPTLTAIAEATTGSYYPLGRLGEGLARVGQSLETTSAAHPAEVRTRGVDRFHAPLAAGLLLLILESLIGTRRRPASTSATAPLASPAKPAFAVCLVLLGFSIARGETNLATNVFSQPPAAPPPTTARGFYNAGTQMLAAGKLPEAETLLQNVLTRQDEALQPQTLYNLGHVRFAQGGEELKKSASTQAARQRANRASASARNAVKAAESALVSEDMQQMIAAYQQGRGARKEIRAATQAVLRAMEAHARTLLKWRRALGDFRSAAELNPADTNAVQNAQIVERAIAELIDRLREMQQIAMSCAGQRPQLNDLLSQLKGKIPKDQMPPGAEGDEEEEDMDGLTLEELLGMMEGTGHEGREMEISLSPEEAGQLLDGFRLDGNRRLPLNQGNEGEPRDPNRRNW